MVESCPQSGDRCLCMEKDSSFDYLILNRSVLDLHFSEFIELYPCNIFIQKIPAIFQFFDNLINGPNLCHTAPLKLDTGTNLTTAEAGAIEYNNTFHVTNSDATRRHVVTAPNTTKVTAGAPYTNDGYITINIGGTDFKVMTTA